MAIMLFGGPMAANGWRTAEVMEDTTDYTKGQPSVGPKTGGPQVRQHRVASTPYRFRISPVLHAFNPLDLHWPRRAVIVPNAGPVELAEGEIATWEDQIGWPIAFTAGDDAGAVLLAGTKTVIGTAPDRATAAAVATAWINANNQLPNQYSGMLQLRREELIDEANAESERQKPDQILILCWETTQGEVCTHILASHGPYMFLANASNCVDCSIQVPDSSGLWVLSETVINSGSSEWQAGIEDDQCLEGKMQRVSVESAAIGFQYTSVEYLVEEAMAYLEEDMNGGATSVKKWLGYGASAPAVDTNPNKWWTPPLPPTTQALAATTPSTV